MKLHQLLLSLRKLRGQGFLIKQEGYPWKIRAVESWGNPVELAYFIRHGHFHPPFNHLLEDIDLGEGVNRYDLNNVICAADGDLNESPGENYRSRIRNILASILIPAQDEPNFVDEKVTTNYRDCFVEDWSKLSFTKQEKRAKLLYKLHRNLVGFHSIGKDCSSHYEKKRKEWKPKMDACNSPEELLEVLEDFFK